jgi:hypothetical protein
MKLIYLEWADAHTQAGWTHKSEMEKWADNSDWFIREAGFLAKETKEYVCLAAFIRPEDKNFDLQYGDLHKIPKTWIRKRKILKV